MFGEARAERYFRELKAAFDLIAQNPRLARERMEIAPPVRIHPHRSHLVVYFIDERGVLILRVRHAREDWDSDPTG